MKSSVPLLVLAVQWLAGGAYVCASSGDDQSLDFCSAAGAVFSGPLIDLEAGLKSAELAIAVAKVSDG